MVNINIIRHSKRDFHQLTSETWNCPMYPQFTPRI